MAPALEALMPYVGHLAGLTTSLLWSITPLLFAAAGRRIGAGRVNATRILLALLWLGLTHRLLSGAWIPVANGRQVLYLGLSGVVGLTIGDLALFTAFVRIGPGRSTLIMTTAPIFAALIGWAVLGETLPPLAWVGIALTVAGVAWVVMESPVQPRRYAESRCGWGVVLAFVGAACQAIGLLLSKAGIGHGWLPREEHLPPQTATLLRMMFAALTVTPMLVWYATRARSGAPSPGSDAAARRWGYVLTLCGSLLGPFLGIWMSLVAADRAPLGVAQTLCSLSPVFILPLSAVVHKERVSPRAALGAVVAVGGTALLFAV